MRVTSEMLNEKIREICDDGTLYNAFGDKSIPYIGWFWRDVDFDSHTYEFGILPVIRTGFDRNDKVRVGFMESNKWGYEYVDCPADTWAEIKMLLEAAVTNPCRETLKAVDDKIQSLLGEKDA